MPVTFGSVGDIISVCSVIKEIIKALDDVRGSSRHYRDVVGELQTLDTALSEVTRLATEYSTIPELAPLFSTAGTAAVQCREVLESFLKSIVKYGKYLGESGSGNALKDGVFKAKWRLLNNDELTTYRAHINAHTSSMSILLSAINITVSKATSEKMENSLRRTIQEAVENELTEPRRIFYSTNSVIQRCERFLLEGSRRFHDSANVLFLKLEWLRGCTFELANDVRQIFALNFQMYGEVMRTQSFVMTLLSRNTLLVAEEPWMLEDCIGRVSPVHKQFITSWKAFYTVLEDRFQGLPGHKRVKRREYTLEESQSGRTVGTQQVWDAAFIPGRRYYMSIVFEDGSESETDTSKSSCPNCKTILDHSNDAEVKCAKCGLNFRRISEIAEESDNDIKWIHNPSAVGIGPRVKKKVTRRRYRPWFKGKFNNSGHKSTNYRENTRKSLNPQDSSDSELDHTAFKRIRLVTHKRKRKREQRLPDKRRKELISENPTHTMVNRLESTYTQEVTNTRENKEETGIANSYPPDILNPGYVNHHDTTENQSFNKTDGGAEDSITSEFESWSIGTSVLEYELFCGRRYNTWGREYLRPNDEQELECQDLLHHFVLKTLDDRLHIAPLVPKRILDIGTGTGIWAIDISDKYGEAHVDGFDLSPVQPSWIPPNLKFFIEDLCEGAPTWSEKPRYDLVRCGHLSTVVMDWRLLICEVKKSLCPGGYLEIQDLIPIPIYDSKYSCDEIAADKTAYIEDMAKLLTDAYLACGINIHAPSSLETIMKESGFTDIQVHEWLVPCRNWPKEPKWKEVGTCSWYWFEKVLDGLTNKPFQKGLKWSNDKRISYINDFTALWKGRGRKIGLGFKLYTIYGKRSS